MSDNQPVGSGNGPSSDGREVVPREKLEAVVQSGRRRRMVGFAGAATVVFAIVGGTFVATQLGDSTPTTTTTHVDATTSTTTPTGLPESTTGNGDDSASSVAPRRRERISEIPAAGTIAFEWETSEFPLPQGIDAWIQALTVVGDGYLAVGQGWEFEGDGDSGFEGDGQSTSHSLVWESADGLNWDLTGTGSFPDGFELNDLLATDPGLVAVGMIFEDEPPWTMTPLVLTSVDGGSWASTALPADLAENEHLYVNGAAAGEAGILVYGSVEFRPPEPPVVFTKDGKTMVIDHDQFTLTITDEKTGAILYEGTPEDIWNDERGETDEGLAVYDPATRELVLVVPWEEFENAYDEVADDNSDESGISLVFESHGYRLVLDERLDEDRGTYRVEDVTSGAMLFSGPSNDLFQGLPSRFEDSQGNVILEFTWHEFSRAEDEAYGGYEEGFEDQYSTRPIVFHSRDGREFAQVDLGPLASNQNAWLDTALAGTDGFTLLGNISNDDSGELFLTWRSSNGIDWTRTAATSASSYVWSAVSTETGFLGLGDGEAVWASSDGGEWEAVFAPRGENGTEIGIWQLVAGELGVFAHGERYQYQEETEGGIFGFEYVTEDGLRIIVEDDYVTLLDPDDKVLLEGFVEELTADRPGESRIETDEEGMVRFYGTADALLFEIHEEELEAATAGPDDSHSSDTTVSHSSDTTPAPATTVVSHDDFEESYTPPEPVLYYSPQGRTFYEVETDGQLAGFFFNQIAVGPDRVILIGEEATIEENFHGSSEYLRTLTVFVGTPTG